VTVRLPLVYAITDREASGIADPARLAERLLRVGVRALQLRDKTMADRELLAAADAIAASSRSAGALFLVNDRADVARLASAGVHLGEDDLPAADARRLLGPEAPIGVSTHDPAAAASAFADAAPDYVAFGPVFETRSKARPDEVVGIDALCTVARRCPVPVVAIGGIDLARAEEVGRATHLGAVIAALLPEEANDGYLSVITERARALHTALASA